MKYLKFLLVLVLPIALMLGCSKVDPVQDLQDEDLALKGTGNNTPSGAHYNLNIIGVPKDKTADMTNNNGGRIFVSLGKSNDGVSTKILLAPGPDFQVLDANGTDGEAKFQLPQNVSFTWKVYARILGKPGGKVIVTTCADSVWVEGLEMYIAAEISCGNPLELTRTTGKGAQKFDEVSDHLLWVTVLADVDANGDGEIDLDAGVYPLFDEAMAGYFWDYDSYGCKLLQLRFYPIQAP